ncbi:hypothetical protein [Xanthomonas campestris]|nr:hypothetical protein [Xanthomonas campestris]MEB1105711.1 hypothetical protein [Xanthomonas campestris pv. campestris]MEB1624108.1 hypothetical protein [Xanthomonas campestris pv. campestris]
MLIVAWPGLAPSIQPAESSAEDGGCRISSLNHDASDMMSQPGLPKLTQEPSGDAAKIDVFATLGMAATPLLGDMVGQAGLGRLIQTMAPLTKAAGAITAPLLRFNNVMVQVGNQLAKDQELMRERLNVLVHKGWFVDPEMPVGLVIKIARAFADNKVYEAEQELVDYYLSSGDDIIRTICSGFPDRAKTICDAFAAQCEGRYSLSVPVFLTQADGIANDCYSDRQLYSAVPDKGVRGLLKSLPEHGVESAYLAVYAEDSPLVKKTSKLEPGFDGLNRHGVLHGTDKHYATQINSLRALSTLTYAAWVLKPRA